MDLLTMLSRTEAVAVPRFRGEWATLAFRPDLASQQEFIVGVAALVEGDAQTHVLWIPSVGKLSALYGEALASSDLLDLFAGVERALRGHDATRLALCDPGTPQLRIIPCGYFAGDDVHAELSELLRQQASAIWTEHAPRENTMGEDWAYRTMALALPAHSRIFLPGRVARIGTRQIPVGLDNGSSYGNIVSARYSAMQTIERHVNASAIELIGAHHLSGRKAAPALFVILPDSGAAIDAAMQRRTSELLHAVDNMGIEPHCDGDPGALANAMAEWAMA